MAKGKARDRVACKVRDKEFSPGTEHQIMGAIQPISSNDAIGDGVPVAIESVATNRGGIVVGDEQLTPGREGNAPIRCLVETTGDDAVGHGISRRIKDVSEGVVLVGIGDQEFLPAKNCGEGRRKAAARDGAVGRWSRVGIYES